jgi:hypothetical protein
MLARQAHEDVWNPIDVARPDDHNHYRERFNLPPMRRERGSNPKKKIPRSIKAEEKEKASAQ